MLVYDITRRKTFENIQKWIHYVEEVTLSMGKFDQNFVECYSLGF